MTQRRLLRRLGRNRRGSTTVEFALVLLPLCVIVMGSLEFGYRIYAESIVVGALRQASRMASTGEYTAAEIDDAITAQLQSFRDDAGITIDKRSYSSFTGVGEPEPVKTGSVVSGTYCYEDVNKNNQYDDDQGAAGIGGAEDVIYYEVQLKYPTFFPFMKKMFGLPDDMLVKSNTIVSNEPFGAVSNATPTVRCVGP